MFKYISSKTDFLSVQQDLYDNFVTINTNDNFDILIFKDLYELIKTNTINNIFTWHGKHDRTFIKDSRICDGIFFKNKRSKNIYQDTIDFGSSICGITSNYDRQTQINFMTNLNDFYKQFNILPKKFCYLQTNLLSLIQQKLKNLLTDVIEPETYQISKYRKINSGRFNDDCDRFLLCYLLNNCKGMFDSGLLDLDIHTLYAQPNMKNKYKIDVFLYDINTKEVKYGCDVERYYHNKYITPRRKLKEKDPKYYINGDNTYIFRFVSNENNQIKELLIYQVKDINPLNSNNVKDTEWLTIDNIISKNLQYIPICTKIVVDSNNPNFGQEKLFIDNKCVFETKKEKLIEVEY